MCVCVCVLVLVEGGELKHTHRHTHAHTHTHGTGLDQVVCVDSCVERDMEGGGGEGCTTSTQWKEELPTAPVGSDREGRPLLYTPVL